MKNIYYLLSLCLWGAMTASCNDWLDVNPRSQMKAEKLFETEDGYKKALTGVYIKMGEPALYGRNTTMYMGDALARMWIIPSDQGSTLNSFSNHRYTTSSAENTISTVFSSYYNAISQLNDVLTNLQGSSVTFSYNNDKLIEGEAKGLRAFMHLELLRFFGPVPSQAVDGNKTIPYVTEMTTNTSKLLSKTWKEVVTSIEKDLNDAENLLKASDPLVHTKVDSLKFLSNIGEPNVPADSWQYFRQSRFNYFATLATKARLYHWIGDKEQAAKYARMVIDAKKFELCDEAYFFYNFATLTMYQEHLFGLNNPDLQTTFDPLYAVSSPPLTQTVNMVNSAYESTIHVNDIRHVGTRYWEEKVNAAGDRSHHFYKYIGNGTIKYDNRVPLIRYVEMYLILSEDLPAGEAKEYFVKYRQTRALSSTIDDPTFGSESALLSRLEKEYRKEFYGEGQLFFFYKMHNYEQLTWPTPYNVPAGGYVLPKPKGLTDFE